MKALQKVSSLLQLSEHEELTIKSCIQNYLLNNPVTTFANAFFSIIGKSDWQVAKQVLNDHLSHTFAQLFQPLDNAKIQYKAAQASEFVLRYLVTESSSKTPTTQFLISKEVFVSEKLKNLRLKEIILRSALGNGSTLPKLDVETIQTITSSCKLLMPPLISEALSLKYPNVKSTDANTPTVEACMDDYRRHIDNCLNDTDKMFLAWNTYDDVRRELELYKLNQRIKNLVQV
ncbi:MAG: hypothetical protein JHC93_01785 [Parachlamydiales bacterium]|nr:hypothetical protein [Parachlamydiales bacterium]